MHTEECVLEMLGDGDTSEQGPATDNTQSIGQVNNLDICLRNRVELDSRDAGYCHFRISGTIVSGYPSIFVGYSVSGDVSHAIYPA